MKREKDTIPAPQVTWSQEERTLTLAEEPVLSYSLSWPQITGAGLGGHWISRYYARLARAWRLRWQRELYLKASLELAEQRAASRPFTPWSCRLAGEVCSCQDGLLSLRLEGEEIRGNGKVNRARWGDMWKMREGTPCLPSELFGQKKGWKRTLLTQITAQGRVRQCAGDWFPDPDWEKRLRRSLSGDSFCLTDQGVEVAFPQCSIAPAAEGIPIFVIPKDSGEKTN